MNADRDEHDASGLPVLEYHTPPGAGLDRPQRPFDWRGCVFGVLVLIGLAVFGVYLCLPNLSAGSEKSNRIKCANNLRQIGQTVLLYANDHGGAFPDDFGQLLIHGKLDSELFVCPSSNEDKANADTWEEVAALLGHAQYCSYVYLGGGLTRGVAADTVIVVEKPANHADEGVHVLTADGKVKWVKQGPDMQRLRAAAATSQPVRLKALP